MKYRVLNRWPKSKPNWGYLPEHDNLTLIRARAIVKSNAHWQPCGLQQQIETTTGKIISTHRSRIVSQSKQDEIRRIYLPELG